MEPQGLGVERPPAFNPAAGLGRHALDLGIVALLFVATFAYRLIYNFDGHAGEWPDVYTYLAAGRQLWRGEEMTSQIIMPLFPLVFGYAGPARMESLNLFFHALTTATIYLMARGLRFPRVTSAIAAVLTIISPLLILYTNVKLSEALYTCLLTIALAFVVYRRAAPATVFLTIGTLVRPIVDLIAPLLILFASPKLTLKSLLKTLGTYIVIYVALMTPWWAYNYNRFDAFVPLNFGGGYSARLENSGHYMQHGFDMSTMFGVFQPYYSISNPVERDAAMKRDAVDWILDHPVDFLFNTFERTGRYLDPRLQLDHGHDLWFMFFTYAVYFFAAAFIFMAPLEAQRRFLPLYLTALFVTALTVATHAVQRYRLPIEPLLYVMAAGGAAILADRWARFVWIPARTQLRTLQERLKRRSISQG